MPERDGLAALQVGVAGHHGVGLGLGERERDHRERLDLLARLGARREDVEAEGGRDLVVARAARVDLAADVAEHAARSRSGRPRRPRRTRSGLCAISASRRSASVELLRGEDPGGSEAAGVLGGGVAVVRQQLAVVGVEELPDGRVDAAAGAAAPEGHVRLLALDVIGSIMPEPRAQGHVVPSPRCAVSSAPSVSAPCGIARGEEDRVVARDRAGDRRVAALVDRLRERGGVPGRGLHDHELPGDLDADRVAPHRGRDRPEPVGVARARRRVDEPAARGAHLDEPELGDVARDGRLHRLVAVGAAAPRRARPGSRSPARRRCGGSRRDGRDAARQLPSAFPIVARARSTSSGGDDERRQQPQHVGAGGEDEQALLAAPVDDRRRPGGRAGHRAAARGPAPRRRRRAPRGPRISCAPRSRDVGEQCVVDRVDDGAGRRGDDRVAAEGRAVVAGGEAAGRAPRGEQRADRQAVAEPLRHRHEVGLEPGLLEGEERAGATDARSAPRRRSGARRAPARSRRRRS